MPLLELPLITAITSTATLIVTLYIGYALDRYHRYDQGRVTLRQRLRHPTKPVNEIRDLCGRREKERGEGE